MPMTLQPEHGRLIAEALRSGAYLDSGEVIQGEKVSGTFFATGAPRGRNNEAQAEGLGQRDPNRYPSPEGAEHSSSIPHVPLVEGDSVRVQRLRRGEKPMSPFQGWGQNWGAIQTCRPSLLGFLGQKRERGTVSGSPSHVFLVNAVAASAGRCQRCAPQERCCHSTFICVPGGVSHASFPVSMLPSYSWMRPIATP